MSQRTLDFGNQKIIIGRGILEGAPALYLHEAASDYGAEPTETEIKEMITNGVALRFVSLEGAVSLLEALGDVISSVEKILIAQNAGTEEVPEAEEVPEEERLMMPKPTKRKSKKAAAK